MSEKPNGVSLADCQAAMRNNRHDLKKIARFEVDRANRKVMQAANAKPHESKKMRQTYTVLDQGPSHGPGYTRPHTMIYSKGLKTGGTVPHKHLMHTDASMASITNHPKQYNRRRTENTIFTQDYLKQWDKIQKIQPVLEASKLNTSCSFNQTMVIASKGHILKSGKD